jgi:hypothetical protein
MTYQVFDEIFLRNVNTPHTLQVLFERYGKHEAGWTFIGDATGQARRTSAQMSDYEHIKSDHRFRNKHVWYPTANPSRHDRFAATNQKFCNAAGERSLTIDPRCKWLAWDLSARAYEAGTREPDDHDDIGHMTDALGYPLHYLAPVKAPQPGAPQVLSA